MAAALEKLLLRATESSMIYIPSHSEQEMYSQDVNLLKLKVQLKIVPDLICAFNAAHPDQS